ncbi:MAG TPA: hypothetical protein VLG76_04750 [Rhabdochlamydiaceae bacterium]|nr:hypothetical protein [Rhabdochlamydiaceae bacterium]
MYLSELSYDGVHFMLSKPLKLVHTEKYNTRLWQKNWCPFVWENTLLITYTINPHEIVYPNLVTGECYPCYETEVKSNWEYGELRGSTPAQLIGEEYLSFFHSGKYTSSQASPGYDLWHYYMGAYTFSPDPPFEMTKMTPIPIVAEGFYTQSNHEKRVIMPGGFVVSGPSIFVAYGKDDDEVWIAILDRAQLQNALVPVQTK